MQRRFLSPFRPLRLRLFAVVVLALSGCRAGVYVQDGVTDGNRFSLPDTLYDNPDPVAQSWAAYSLARSVCQLEMGGENPARNHSFDCELTAREVLIDRWSDFGDVNRSELRSPAAAYLERMADAGDAGFLDEYVWVYLKRRGWLAPDSLQLTEFKRWQESAGGWDRHRPDTRIIGSWGYPPGYRAGHKIAE